MRFPVPVLAIEGRPTDDGRTFNSIGWRPLPLTLYAQHTNSYGHEDAPIAGQIVEIGHGDDGVLTAIIDTDDEGPHGMETARLIRRGDLRGISVDLAIDESTLQWIDTIDEGTGELVSSEMVVGQATVMAATVVGMPAFGEAQIDPTPIDEAGNPIPEMDDDEELAVEDDGAPVSEVFASAASPTLALVAAAVDVASLPPASWFADPQLSGPTPLTIDDEGRIFGHLAEWDVCHIGIEGVCVTAPRTAAGYSYFMVGEMLAACDDGCGAGTTMRLPVGTLTMATGHAAPTLGARPAAAHYDDTGTVAADIAVGEDAYGIWAAGQVRPEVMADPDALRRLRSSAPSGDWRRIGGNLELVAALQVNTPGFPVRRALAASGEVMAGTQVHVEAGVQTCLIASSTIPPAAMPGRRTTRVVSPAAPDPRIGLLMADRAAELSRQFAGPVARARATAERHLQSLVRR